jgi:inward rectifier potassium channel
MISRRRPAVRLTTMRDFGIRIKGVGRRNEIFSDFYHFFLTRSWWQFFSLIGIVYLLVNALFAGLYLIDVGGLANATPGSFEDAFFFSVQTMATIGYGAMSPASLYTHILVTLEAILGMLGVALVTGLTYAKFARPTAKVLFSSKMVVSVRNGVPTLMFRMANWRHNQVFDVQLRAIILVEERTREGETLRRPIEIKLVRDRTMIFNLSFTAMHIIDEHSPFYGKEHFKRLREGGAQIFVSLTGNDDTFAQMITARHTYSLHDIVWYARFVDAISFAPDGTRLLDYHQFHEYLPLPKDVRPETPTSPTAPATPVPQAPAPPGPPQALSPTAPRRGSALFSPAPRTNRRRRRLPTARTQSPHATRPLSLH